jgi:hypothetical protein
LGKPHGPALHPCHQQQHHDQQHLLQGQQQEGQQLHSNRLTLTDQDLLRDLRQPSQHQQQQGQLRSNLLTPTDGGLLQSQRQQQQQCRVLQGHLLLLNHLVPSLRGLGSQEVLQQQC